MGRHKETKLSEENKPPDGAAPATPAATNPANTILAPDGTYIGYADIKRIIKETSELKAIVTAQHEADRIRREAKAAGKGGSAPAPTPAPSNDVADQLAQLRAEMALKDALSDRGVTKEKALVMRLWKSEKPADVGVWLDETLRSIKDVVPAAVPSAVPAAVPAAVPPPLGQSNQGAPVRGANQGAPTKLTAMSEGEVQAMHPNDVMKLFNEEFPIGGVAGGGRRTYAQAAAEARKRRNSK